MIPFHRPTFTGNETANVLQAIDGRRIGPGGTYVTACQDWLSERFQVPLALPTGSCTAALEMAALLLDLKAGDEVILPSFAYTSTATAFARTGARLVFVDIDPATMNLDPGAVEAAITDKTRAIVLVHYAGIACDMERFLAIAERHDLAIVEDAALAFLARHEDRLCGTLGTFGCFSFHESKSIHCGQGGALLINKPEFVARAEIILEKGTDRRQFLRGEVDRYSWRDIGSSFALENIRAAFLLAQLQASQAVVEELTGLWWRYHARLAPLARSGLLELAEPPAHAQLNGHLFWLKLADLAQRDALIAHLRARGVHAVFHYVPLHSAAAGLRFGRFSGKDRHTSRDAARLLRLPLFQGFDDLDRVVDLVFTFFEQTGSQAPRRKIS